MNVLPGRRGKNINKNAKHEWWSVMYYLNIVGYFSLPTQNKAAPWANLEKQNTITVSWVGKTSP